MIKMIEVGSFKVFIYNDAKIGKYVYKYLILLTPVLQNFGLL